MRPRLITENRKATSQMIQSSTQMPDTAERKPGQPAAEPFRVDRLSVVIPVYNGAKTIAPPE